MVNLEASPALALVPRPVFAPEDEAALLELTEGTPRRRQ